MLHVEPPNICWPHEHRHELTEYLQVRQRTKLVLERAKKNELKHFDVDLEKVHYDPERFSRNRRAI